MLKKSQGNMYPWVTHTHSHLGGECPHKCSYCYVNNPRFGRPLKYQGELRLIEDEFKVKYGEGKTIFVENCNDMFAKEVPDGFINLIIDHCLAYPQNTYVLQSKNPDRMLKWVGLFEDAGNFIVGTTIESNRWYPQIMGTAPAPECRASAMMEMCSFCVKRFVTVEPVLDFDVDVLANWIAKINPAFLNLGADSKGRGLPEPTFEKIMALTAKLKEYGIELREKHNLERLKK